MPRIPWRFPSYSLQCVLWSSFKRMYISKKKKKILKSLLWFFVIVSSPLLTSRRGGNGGGKKKHTHSFLQSRYALEFSHLVNTKKTPLFSFSFLFPPLNLFQLPSFFYLLKMQKKQQKKISTKRVLLFIHENEKIFLIKMGGEAGGKTDWKKSEHNSLSPLFRCRHLILREAASWHGSKYSLFLLLFEKKKRKTVSFLFFFFFFSAEYVYIYI